MPSTDDDHNRELSVIIRETPFYTPFDAKTDNIEILLPVLIHDTARNELIVEDIKKEVLTGRKILVLTERKAHVNILRQYLKGSIETIAISGDDATYLRKSKLNQIEEGNFQVLIATGQFMGEGIDINALDCLVLAYPFSFEGKLIQYIGRVQRNAIKPVIYDYRDYKIEYLDKQFKQRNKYYRKLTKSGQLKSFEELILLFDEDRFYIQSMENEFSIEDLDLPLPIDKFLPGTCWKIRVLKYDETGELMCEIMDYNHPEERVVNNLINEFYFQGIEKIKFRSINTAAFLKAVVLKKSHVSQQEIKINTPPKPLPEQVIIKTMKVPFSKVSFLNGSVSFALYIQEVNQEASFEVLNPDIRPEFEAIREYFIKALKKKNITTDITIWYNQQGITLATAKSDDIDCINSSLIESVRFEFVKRHLFKPKEGILTKPSTLEEMAASYNPAVGQLFSSEQNLLNNILDVKDSKHYHHLKYLSSKHEAGILKLRFILQPFSFLFLLAGEKKYHIIWETLDSEEATYIWHSEKSREALRKTLDEIEEVIIVIKKSGRQEYLKQDHANFSRVLHDYSDAKKGFVTWKGMLEERLM